MLTITKRNRLASVASIAAAGMMFLGASGQARADLATAIQDGGDRLVGLQDVDGKWGWPLNAPPTYNNIVGPIGLGLLNAYGQTSDIAHLDSAKAAGDALVLQTESWVGTYNPMFLLALYDETGDAAYQTQVQTFFSELANGTYTTSGNDYDTDGFITRVQTAGGRDGVWKNLRPWEFAPLAYAADVAGLPGQAPAFLDAMKQGIDTLDSSNPNAVYSDLIGLAGGVLGLGWLNEDFDPTAGSFAAASSTDDLADLLAGYQNVNGSWNWHTNLVSPASDDEDLQTTAYALLALLANNDSNQYGDEIVSGRNYLLGQQLPNGGWDNDGGSENAEIDGEILWALAATSSVVPEPASMALLGLGGLALVRRR